jgi:hypothetical protein
MPNVLLFYLFDCILKEEEEEEYDKLTSFVSS